ncbi:uncharacterized protein LOC124170315 [Ischnura elegans]|uniref:uncharacterized protein LOC124170315 n=1 Tax=Ischnura elegans TaxID=197161 RepID=UPI001ED88722|nr:uncharacterized protein LOC124170315 [Ischnura elegans]
MARLASRYKKKASKIRTHASGSGGGGRLKITPLTELEQQVLSLVGEKAVDGEDGLVDPLIHRISQESHPLPASDSPSPPSSPDKNPIYCLTSYSPTTVTTSHQQPFQIPLNFEVIQNHISAIENAISKPSPMPSTSQTFPAEENHSPPVLPPSNPVCDTVPRARKRKRPSPPNDDSDYILALAAKERTEHSKAKAIALSSLAESMRDITASLKMACQAIKDASDEYGDLIQY